MAKKAKQGKNGKKAKEKVSSIEGLWIAPRNNLKGPTSKRAWENVPDDRPSNNRFLELADIALGLERTNSKNVSFRALGKIRNFFTTSTPADGYQSHKTL